MTREREYPAAAAAEAAALVVPAGGRCKTCGRERARKGVLAPRALCVGVVVYARVCACGSGLGWIAGYMKEGDS